MLISDRYRRCTAFLFANGEARATAFQIGYPLNGSDVAVYTVTARHVVEAAGHMDLRARVNIRDGNAAHLFEVPKDGWRLHPDTDVAVMLNWWSSDQLNTTGELAVFEGPYVPVDVFVTAAARETVGIGDEVFTVGLFAPHPGVEYNLPVARFGTVALTPEKPVRAKIGWDTYGEIEAYLMEAHSRGGQSGSPVFVYYRSSEASESYTEPPPVPKLLGLVQGHWDEGAENLGMAVVVPAWAILELLEDSEVVSDRAHYQRELEKVRPAATPD